MGWYGERINKPIKKWFEDNSNNENYSVLDVSIVGFHRLYAAIKNNKTNEVYCEVLLFSYSNKAYDNFTYKPLSEFSGPCAYDCPERILKQLTPLDETISDNKYAIEWRKKCWNKIERRKKLRKITNKNILIKTPKPIEFSDGEHYQYFRKVGKRIQAYIFSNKNNEFSYACDVSIDLSCDDFDTVFVNNLA